jgi:acetyltransferase-like isoleucine patch superfamily enzyme
MQASELIQRLCRKLVLLPSPSGILRKAWLRFRGAQIAGSTNVPRLLVTWPHQMRIGERCVLQPDIFFNYDSYWTPGPSIRIANNVFVGRGVEFNIAGGLDVEDDALIAAGCIFVDHDHGTDPSLPMNLQPNKVKPITVGRNAWLGANCVVLKGVSIGAGAIVGAGSVVTKSIPAGEIWAGAPARKIR